MHHPSIHPCFLFLHRSIYPFDDQHLCPLIPNPPLSTNAQVGTTYSVARIMHGDVEEAPGYNSASGEVRTTTTRLICQRRKSGKPTPQRVPQLNTHLCSLPPKTDTTTFFFFFTVLSCPLCVCCSSSNSNCKVRIGDAKVGYFKILFLPKDIDAPRDSLKVQYTSRF